MKTEENTETAPAETGSTTPVTPELLAHVFNDQGVCSQPENVKIPMPKGFACVLHLALDAEGLWHYGKGCEAGGEVAGHLPSNAPMARAFTTRGDALGAALGEAREFFATQPRGKKAVAALEFFAASNSVEIPGAVGSPANIGADGADTSADAVAPVKGEFAEIPVSAVQPSPRNHRKIFDEDAIGELAESIRREGLLQPIAVREIEAEQLPGMADLPPAAPRYEIILGERRWRAHVKLGAETIQAQVYRGIDSDRAQVLALIENLQRVQLDPIEEAEGYAELIGAGLTQDAIAQRVGRSRPVVANALRLLKLPQEVLDYIRKGELTVAHGVALARFADWPKHLQLMADLAVQEETTAAGLEKGVPFAWMLVRQNLAVTINSWDEFKVTDKLKKHPAYFSDGNGNYVCFDPAHWVAEVEQRREAAKARAATEAEKKAKELAKASKGGKKALSLAELDSENYRRFEEPAQAALLDLVPDDKKAVAKGYGDEGRVTIVTDVALADKLKAAMQRAIKADRKAKVDDLAAKVRKKIAGLKKIGPREWGWLLYLITTYEGRNFGFDLAPGSAEQVGLKLPSEFADGVGAYDGGFGNDLPFETGDRRKSTRSVFEILSTCEPVDLVKVLMEERLDKALESLVESGPSGVGARHLRWWLDTDTLWLLEETDDGRGELLEQVKNAPWYKALLAGETAAEKGGAE